MTPPSNPPFAGIGSMTPLEAALRYIEHGIRPVPIPYKQKGPKIKYWPSLIITPENAGGYFTGGPQNIGAILDQIADVDCDCDEAVIAAPHFLPRTGMVFGRASRPASHYFYCCEPTAISAKYTDPADKKTVLELRCRKKDGSVGEQTVIPPSVHPEGECVRFEPGGDGLPTKATAAELYLAVARVAAAALLARHWPQKGQRHEAMLALGGGLCRAGWPLIEAQQFCRAVYIAVPTHDPKAVRRSDSEVEDTYKKALSAIERREEPTVTGWPTLAKIIGDNVVSVAMQWLGVSAGFLDATELRPKAEPAPEPPQPGVVIQMPPRSDSPGAPPAFPPPQPDRTYREEGGGIVRYKKSGNAEEKVPLTNFTARITTNVLEDDGVETKRHLGIEAVLNHRKSEFMVPAARFASMDWPIEHIGPTAIVYPNQKDWARAAIQTLSRDVVEHRVLTHTGWRKTNGVWVYLHVGGGIGEHGPADGVDVRLYGSLSRYQLLLPENEGQLVAAVRASLRVLDLAPAHITFPLLAAAYRACIKESDFAAWFVGPTGVFKSELAALAQQHYGAGMDARHLPGNFASTGNALEALAFHAKDALLVVDDFAPHGSTHDVARYHGAAERILRAAGNNQGRGRLNSESKLRESKPPRGLVLATGEDVPRGQSIRGRTFIVEVTHGDVRTNVLTELQHVAVGGLLAQSLGGFVMWLARDYEAIQDAHRARILELRSKATKAHSRTAGIVAELFAGLELFFRFARENGAITEQDEAALQHRAWEALNTVARAQRANQEASEPAHRFLDLLRAALVSGQAHVACVDGHEPRDPEFWGWREEGTEQHPRTVAKGRCIGWLDGQDLYLNPTASYAVAQDLGRGTGEPLVVSEGALKKRLKEEGFLASVDAARETLTVRRSISGAQMKVLHFAASTLTGNVGFSGPNVGSLSGSGTQPDITLAKQDNDLQANVGFVGSNSGGEGAQEVLEL